MKNWKIGTRLGFCFALAVLLQIMIAVLAVDRLQTVNNASKIIAENHVPKVILLQKVTDNLNIIARANRNVLLFDDPKVVNAEIARVHESRKNIAEVLSTIEKHIDTPKGRELLAQLNAAGTPYTQTIDKFQQFIKDGNHKSAKNMLLAEIRTTQTAYMSALEKFRGFVTEALNQAEQEADRVYVTTRILIGALSLVAAIIAVLASLFVTRSITRPLKEAVMVAETVAAGDLTSRIEAKSKDETGQLMHALKNMNDSLLGIVGQVRTGTDTIATASAQIAAGNHDLSSRTEQQASSLEETASSMEELTSTVRQNADNARQANQLAVTASDVAIKGGAVVSQVVETMSSINDSSKKMADIISVIDGIAFQTNILALNAAVEAARAGEQGRGFAVVATEVRGLAQRSASAAREIKALIDDSVSKVGEGTKLVADAGATMEEVVASIRRVHDIMGEITTASSEQSEGIEQVNQAITQMDQVTQQNAALVEEAAAAAESMQDQAASLLQAVSVFRTGQNTVAAAPVRKSASKPSVAPGQVATRAAPKPANVPKIAAPKSASGEDWEEF